MQTRIVTYAMLCSLFLLEGCGNTMYFYETEKVSLTVEARPDSSQPVQGNLGIKQRAALVVPKMNDNNNGGGEALSAISSFNLRIKDESGFNPILIQTAFITGKAAAGLKPEEAADAAEAIVVLKGVSTSTTKENANCVAKKAKENNKLNDLKEIVTKKDFDKLSEEDWTELLSIVKGTCGISGKKNYGAALHEELQKQLTK